MFGDHCRQLVGQANQLPRELRIYQSATAATCIAAKTLEDGTPVPPIEGVRLHDLRHTFAAL